MRPSIEGALKWLLAPETASGVPSRQPVGGFGPGTLTGAQTLKLSEPAPSTPTHLWPRWIFLRALGLINFSAFYSLLFQIKGLIGPNGILPASDYLQAIAAAVHSGRFWYVPTLFWFGSTNHALMLVCWLGLIASLL